MSSRTTGRSDGTRIRNRRNPGWKNGRVHREVSGANRNWLCLECRCVARKYKSHEGPCPCQECGKPMKFWGWTDDIPRKNNINGWRKIKDFFEGFL